MMGNINGLPTAGASCRVRRQSLHCGVNGALHMIQSGPKLSPDWCPTRSKETRIGLRFKISPNKLYFGNRTK